MDAFRNKAQFQIYQIIFKNIKKREVHQSNKQRFVIKPNKLLIFRNCSLKKQSQISASQLLSLESFNWLCSRNEPRRFRHRLSRQKRGQQQIDLQFSDERTQVLGHLLKRSFG